MKLLFLLLSAALVITGCKENSTADIPAVRNFDLNKYLGNWYEIARLPNSFEKGMRNVSTRYSLRRDGKIKVENHGVKNGQPVQITGVAQRAGNHNTGELKVSFFRPFYGTYRIIWLTPDYSVAIVTGNTRNLLWVLARKKSISPDEKSTIIDFLKKHRFPVNELIYSWE